MRRITMDAILAVVKSLFGTLSANATGTVTVPQK